MLQPSPISSSSLSCLAVSHWLQRTPSTQCPSGTRYTISRLASTYLFLPLPSTATFPTLLQVLAYADYVFTSVFTAEIVLKVSWEFSVCSKKLLCYVLILWMVQCLFLHCRWPPMVPSYTRGLSAVIPSTSWTWLLLVSPCCPWEWSEISKQSCLAALHSCLAFSTFFYSPHVSLQIKCHIGGKNSQGLESAETFKSHKSS